MVYSLHISAMDLSAGKQYIVYAIVGALILFLVYYAYRVSFPAAKAPATSAAVAGAGGAAGTAAAAPAATERFASAEVTLLYSPTCPHCVKFHPTFDNVSKEFADRATFKALHPPNIPADLAAHVEGFPTVVVYKDGAFVTKNVGNVPEQVFREFLSSAL